MRQALTLFALVLTAIGFAETAPVQFATEGYPSGYRLSSDNRWVATLEVFGGSNARTADIQSIVNVRNASSGVSRLRIQRPNISGRLTAAFSPNSEWFAVMSRDHARENLWIWRVRGEAFELHAARHLTDVRAADMMFTADSASILFTGYLANAGDRRMEMGRYEIARDRIVERFYSPIVHLLPLGGDRIAAYNNRERLFSGSWGNRNRFETREPFFIGDPRSGCSCAGGPDITIPIRATPNGSVFFAPYENLLWMEVLGREGRFIPIVAQGNDLSGVASTPDSRYLLVGTPEGQLIWMETASGVPFASVSVGTSVRWGEFQVSADGRYLTSNYVLQFTRYDLRALLRVRPPGENVPTLERAWTQILSRSGDLMPAIRTVAGADTADILARLQRLFSEMNIAG